MQHEIISPPVKKARSNKTNIKLVIHVWACKRPCRAIIQKKQLFVKCDVATIYDQYLQFIFVKRAPGLFELDWILDLHDFCINMMKYFDVSSLLHWISQKPICYFI